MSQQPPEYPSSGDASGNGPYGQPGAQPGQQYPAYPAYNAGPSPYAPPPYGTAPIKKDNTTRNVLIIVGVLMVLFCGGGVVGMAVLVSNIDSGFDSDYRGSEDDPLTVEVGEAFEIRGFEYDEGWSIGNDEFGDDTIVGLVANNERDDDDPERSSLEFTFLDDARVVAQVRCFSEVNLTPGRSREMDCNYFGSEPIAGYDTVEVYDTSLFE